MKTVQSSSRFLPGKICRLWCLAVVCTMMLAVAAGVSADDEGTILRHENFLAFVAEPDENVVIAVESLARGPFTDDLEVMIIEPDSFQALGEIVPLGTTREIPFTTRKAGLHVVRLATAQTLYRARLVERPFALVAWEGTRVWITGAMVRQHFFVPEKKREFSLFVTASVVTEGATVKIWSPAGEVVLEETDDFVKTTELKVTVPEGMDGQVWTLALEDPGLPNLFLDDVELYLGRGMPPYLCEDPQWLPIFVKRTRGEPESIAAVVKLGNLTMRNGETTDVTFTIDALPDVSQAALRGAAHDVDYVDEGVFTVNGQGRYSIPVTGDATLADYTVLIDIEHLRAGENTFSFIHDNRASGVMALYDTELLLGENIRTEELW